MHVYRVVLLFGDQRWKLVKFPIEAPNTRLNAHAAGTRASERPAIFALYNQRK